MSKNEWSVLDSGTSLVLGFGFDLNLVWLSSMKYINYPAAAPPLPIEDPKHQVRETVILLL